MSGAKTWSSGGKASASPPNQAATRVFLSSATPPSPHRAGAQLAGQLAAVTVPVQKVSPQLSAPPHRGVGQPLSHKSGKIASSATAPANCLEP
jgi:hypothetical protein